MSSRLTDFIKETFVRLYSQLSFTFAMVTYPIINLLLILTFNYRLEHNSV